MSDAAPRRPPRNGGRRTSRPRTFRPPRSGRLSLTATPLDILKALFGPRCMMIFCCVLCCVLVAVLWFYLGLYFVNIYTELEAFGLVGGDDAADDAGDDAY